MNRIPQADAYINGQRYAIFSDGEVWGWDLDGFASVSGLKDFMQAFKSAKEHASDEDMEAEREGQAALSREYYAGRV